MIVIVSAQWDAAAARLEQFVEDDDGEGRPCQALALPRRPAGVARHARHLRPAADGGMTIVNFGHREWKEPVEFMGHCSMKWAVFLMSLRALVETGRGKPSPEDVKIDNWN